MPPPAVDLGAWLARGGPPELALDPGVDRQPWLGSDVQTHVERDAGVTGPTIPPESPKLDLLDTGLVSFLVGLHGPGAALQGPAAGALVETAVVARWVTAFRQVGELPSLVDWRTSAGLDLAW